MNDFIMLHKKDALKFTRGRFAMFAEDCADMILEEDSAAEIEHILNLFDRNAYGYRDFLIKKDDDKYILANVIAWFFMINDPYGYESDEHINYINDLYNALTRPGNMKTLELCINQLDEELNSGGLDEDNYMLCDALICELNTLIDDTELTIKTYKTNAILFNNATHLTIDYCQNQLDCFDNLEDAIDSYRSDIVEHFGNVSNLDNVLMSIRIAIGYHF